MGRSCKAVHKVLTEEPQTVTEIVVATGKVRNTVKTALTELQQLGATSQVDGGFIVGEHSMKELCHVLGAQDLTTQRRNKNELQRKAYRRWMETSGTVSGSKG
jgi:DNA-binding IclR family transcriptional regulator